MPTVPTVPIMRATTMTQPYYSSSERHGSALHRVTEYGEGGHSAVTARGLVANCTLEQKASTPHAHMPHNGTHAHMSRMDA